MGGGSFTVGVTVPPPRKGLFFVETKDVHKLFDLLEKLYQGKKKPRDEATLAIWREVLRPWTYEQVRTAVIERSRVNRFSPDPSELAEFLPPPPKRAETVDRYRIDPRDRRQMKRVDELMDQAAVEKGFPTAAEAKVNGMDYHDWLEALEAAGVDICYLEFVAWMETKGG